MLMTIRNYTANSEVQEKSKQKTRKKKKNPPGSFLIMKRNRN